MQTVAAVTIEVLGGFRVAVDGRVVEETTWTARRAMELVQLLAIRPGHRLTRDQAVDLLWPHLDPGAGAANLRKAAHHARQVLGDPDAVVLRGGTVRLFPGRDVVTDVARFEAAAEDALRRGDAAACAAAAAGYGGELLPGSRYEDWSQDARRHAHGRLVDLLRGAGDWEALAQAEPTDEGAYQALMRAAIDAGLRPAAIRWFGIARAVLATELGVSPSPRTMALYDEAIQGLHAAPSTLIGRDLVVARARALLRDAPAERLGAVIVRGPAGIGKSAVAHELARIAPEEGYAVRWAGVPTAERAYGPLIALIDEILLSERALLAAVGSHVHAVLAALTATATPAPEPDGPLSRHQVIGALSQLLRACSGGRPSLVVLDDAHLVDDATLDVVAHLASSVPDVVVLLTARDGTSNPGLGRRISRLVRSGRAVAVDLSPLDDEATRALARDVSTRSLDVDTVDRIAALAEGNPFATVELARAASPGRADALPTTVAEAVATRFVSLDPTGVAVLQRLALAGDGFDTSTAVALAGASEEPTYDVLDRALDAGVLVVVGSRYRFRHDLLRQALVELVPPHQRLLVHREAAECLARLGAAPGMVARHWLAAERPEEAVPWLVAAAESAMQVGAFTDARQQVGSVLAHDPGHRRARRLDAEALDMTGDPACLAAYDAAIAVADPDEVDDLVAMRALAQVKQGDPAGGLRAITGARPASLIGRLSEALAYAGAAALGATDPAMGTAKAAECRRLALETGDRSAIVIASWAQAAAAHARGELHDAVLADLRDTQDLPHLAVRVFDGHLCIMQRFLYGARPYDEVIAFADGVTAEAQRVEARRGEAFGVTLRGEAELLSGQLDRAEVDLTEAVRLHRATAGVTGEAHALQRLAEVALHRGDRDRASDLLDEALDLARVTDIGFHLLDRIYGARIAVAEDPAEAVAMVDEADDAVHGPLETCPGCRITFAVPAAIACARGGAVDRAAELESAVEYLARVVMRLPAWDAAYDEVRANVALAVGATTQAHELFRAAADRYGTAGQPLDQARCASLATA